MSKIWSFLFLIGVALWMNACSSSPTSSTGTDEATPAADAGTDAVPQASAETPPTSPPDSAATDPADAPKTETAKADSPQADPAKTDAAPAPAAAPAPGVDAPPPVAEAAAAPGAIPPVAADANAGAAPTTLAKADEKAPAPSPEVKTEPKMETVADTQVEAKAEAPAETQAAGSGSGITTHTVHRGDTLMQIAFRVYGDLFRWKEIYEANKDKIKDPNALPVGLELNIQDATPVKVAHHGEKYMIRRGDTLGSISKDVYGTRSKWKKIWKNNKELIKDPNKIFAGFYLYYTMTPQDREKQKEPTPLAESGTPAELGNAANRSPASMPSMPQMPARSNATNMAAPPVPNAVAAPAGN